MDTSAKKGAVPACRQRRHSRPAPVWRPIRFRDGRNGKHPCALQDITAGVRFVRANAGALGVDGKRIGMVGSSSGGHLALLAATQPDIDAHRGTSILVDGAETPAADVSARVCCVASLWPVSNPLFRLRYAERAVRAELVAAHDSSGFATASLVRLPTSTTAPDSRRCRAT